MPEEDDTVRAGQPLLAVDELRTWFPVRSGVLQRVRGYVKAVDGVSFAVSRCETLALVGESGCGKTTAGKSIVRLLDPTSGRVVFDGRDITRMNGSQLQGVRKDLQIIFQDPYSSLNPRMAVGEAVAEGLRIHCANMGARETADRVAEILRHVGLSPDSMKRYPHEFSGGQRQRIGIARALAVGPKFIVCDEPVSALDVSVQAQILNLLSEIQEQMGIAYLFITHDLRVVEYMAHHVAVMYLGKIVEIARAEQLFSSPLHPYTMALLSAVPIPDPSRRGERIVLQGDVPSPLNPPTGCAFHPRCPKAKPECSSRVPEMKTVGPFHSVRCLLVEAENSNNQDLNRE